jgi:lysophospholipase L1-like esterase
MALMAVRCGGHPHPGPDPIADPPTLTCPADQQAIASQGRLPTVAFDVPVAQGGQAPVTVTCSPGPGSVFNLGDTGVTCTANDGLARTAACSFIVSVSQPPLLAATRFVAFGDSLTEGVTAPSPTILTLNLPDSYPLKLQLLLSARYTDQTIEVFNEGCSGEFVNRSSVHCPGALKRLPDVLRNDTPQVLLLLHGANDLLEGKASAVSTIVGALEKMVSLAQDRGVRVYVATFPPQDPAGSRGAGAPYLPELNRKIAAMAADEGATLVDLFNGLGGSPVGVIGADGLHPTPAGYQMIAQIWADALEATLEQQPPPPTLTLTRGQEARK